MGTASRPRERRRARNSTPQIRLLWDELLSPLVPQALRILMYNATYVGNTEDKQPPKGASDEDIVAHARHTHQVIVTSNHDMMQICAEAAQPFVWIDPRGRQLTRARQVLLVLQQVDRWVELLGADPTVCIHAMRTKCKAILPNEAARLATQRMRANERRRSAVPKRRSASGPLLTLSTEEP